jgi:hypothetical protein
VIGRGGFFLAIRRVRDGRRCWASKGPPTGLGLRVTGWQVGFCTNIAFRLLNEMF